MKRFQKFLYGLHPLLLSSIATVLTIAQVILAFFFNQSSLVGLRQVGWIFWWIAAIFGILPIITFRRKGGVAQGESYDTGIYAIVRHPQGGTAWLLINTGLMLIAQQWSSVVLGLTSMVLVYADTFKSDQYCIEKFGDAYRRYIERVPRVNFVAGVIRLIGRRMNAL